MSDPSLGWQLSWSDYTGHAEGRRRVLKRGQKRSLPQAHVEMFRTRAEAEAALARLRDSVGDGLVATVMPVPVKPPKASAALLDDLPTMRKRMT